MADPKAMTAPQAEALAAILHQLRPTWAVPAIMDAFRKNWKHPAPYPVLVQAAINAANQPDRYRAPHSIYWDGPHWPTGHGTDPRIKDTCPDHSTEHRVACRACAADVKAGMRPAEMAGQHYVLPEAA
ncbi:hypothetical protein [Kocuria sp. cx-455]|uniref:hypothetical protein n=1 Tax=Kocuria sp. cx-455 TaxID=2771377 RepID=UPI003D752F31